MGFWFVLLCVGTYIMILMLDLDRSAMTIMIGFALIGGFIGVRHKLNLEAEAAEKDALREAEDIKVSKSPDPKRSKSGNARKVSASGLKPAKGKASKAAPQSCAGACSSNCAACGV